MIKLDNISISKEDFDKKLKENRDKGITLKEVSPGVWKTLKKLRD